MRSSAVSYSGSALEQPRGNWRNTWRGPLLAVVAGALLPLAFAPLAWYPLGIICPALIFWLWMDVSPRRAGWLGYVFGLGFFGLGVSWVSISMYQFSGMGLALSGIATTLFVLFLALFPALLGWVARRWCADLSSGVWLVVCLPALWVLLEWVRGWIFTGFPWLLLGYSQTDSLLIGVAPVLGVYGVSWFSAMSAGLLVWCWSAAGRAQLAGLLAVVVIWICAGVLSLHEWSSPNGDPLEVSLVQGNVDQNLKWRAEYRAQTIELYTELSRPRWSRDIIVWPETALPVLYSQAQTFLEQLAMEARQTGGAELVIGLPMRNEQDGYYNAVVKLGEQPQFYRKSHLVPFGEYIPFKSSFGDLLDLMQVPMANFSRGEDRQTLIQVAGQKAGVSICYEDAFGEEVIRGLPEATVLINVTNDAWFGDSMAPHQHLQMARMRSIETSRPMLRATNNGVSALIDHRGTIINTSPQFEVAVLDGEVVPRAGSTLYVRLGNTVIIVIVAFALLLSIIVSRKNQSSLIKF